MATLRMLLEEVFSRVLKAFGFGANRSDGAEGDHKRSVADYRDSPGDVNAGDDSDGVSLQKEDESVTVGDASESESADQDVADNEDITDDDENRGPSTELRPSDPELPEAKDGEDGEEVEPDPSPDSNADESEEQTPPPDDLPSGIGKAEEAEVDTDDEALPNPPRLRRPKKVRLSGTTAPKSSGRQPRKGYLAPPKLECLQLRGREGWSLRIDLGDYPPEAKVWQGDQELLVEDSGVVLDDYRGTVVVYLEGQERSKVRLFDGSTPLIFRTRKDWEGIGRREYQVRWGHYVVLAPKEWKRTGHQSMEMEGCADETFRVHFFELDRKNKGSSGGGLEGCPTVFVQKLAIVGECVEDLLSDEAPLYTDPQISFVGFDNSVCTQVWGYGSDDWETECFYIDQHDLPEKLEGRWGRYEVTLANPNGDEIANLYPNQFRYCPSLGQILLNGMPYDPEGCWLPDEHGHRPAKLQFEKRGGGGISAIPSNSPLVNPSTEPGSYEIPASPLADLMDWKLTSPEPKGGSLSVRVHVPRLWWRLAGEGIVDDSWRDSCPEVTLKKFHAMAKRKVWVEFQHPPSVSAIRIGIDDKVDQSKRADLGFGLRAVAEYLPRRCNHHRSWELRMKIPGEEEIVTLVRITQPPPPPPTDEVDDCAEGTEGVPANVGVALVNGRRGWRTGRGFSLQELAESGITIAMLREMGGRPDKRRRSVYRNNVSILKGEDDAEE